MRAQSGLMKQFSTIFVLSIALIPLISSVSAQSDNTPNTLKLEKDKKSPPAKIEEVAWIAGDWIGDALGGKFEESWNAPSGGSMLGMFKLVVDGSTSFSEHMAILPQGESLVLRIKHFDGQLKGWEEKDQWVDFPLVKLTQSEAYFSGLTFRKTAEKGLAIFVSSKNESGALTELQFQATLAGTTAKPSSTPEDYTAWLAEIDQYAQKVQKDWEVPGLAVAIVKGDKVLMSKGYGVRDINTKEPVDERTLFAVASNSKAFTAASLAILVDEGKISWDDPVIKYLPKFQMPDPWTTREMTIRDLLCHRSGMDTFSGDLLWYDTNYSADKIVDRIRYLKPVSSFRSRFGYQNLMYITAGKVIEQVSGKNWAEFVQSRILDPLEMKQTTTSIKQIKGNFASPHNKSGGAGLRALPLGDVDNSWGACGINSSVSEMAKWMQLQLAGGKIGGKQIISGAQLHTMWQPWLALQQPAEAPRQSMKNFQAYGLGYFLMDWYGHKVVHHSGGLDGMISQLALVPSLDLGVVVLTNSESSASRFVRDRVLECFMEVAERPDRSGESLAKFLEAESNKAEALAKQNAERKSDSVTTIPIPDFAGRFRSELYGDVIVKHEADKLVLSLEPAPNFVADLEHWQYNTFLIHWRSSVKYNFPRGFVTFTVDAQGKPSQLIIDQPNDDFWFYELDLRRVP